MNAQRHSYPATVIEAAHKLASDKGECAYILLGEGGYYTVSDSTMRDAFAEGDMSQAEFDREYAATVRPAPTAGERAYVEDCRRKPNYHTGEKRHAWADLPPLTRWSWERNPTPRDW